MFKNNASYNRYINLTLLVVSILITIISIEAIFIIFRPEYKSIYQPDKKLLFKLVPNGIKEFRRLKINGGQKILVKINGNGFRGDEFRIKSSRKRIVVYGDSFIEADYSELKNTFCNQLENIINSNYDAKVEVINAGVTGYGPDQSLLKLMEDCKSLNPDLIIFSIYSGNDFGDLLRNKMFYADTVLNMLDNKTKDNNSDLLQLKNSKKFVLDPILRDCLFNEAFPSGIRKLNFVRYIERKIKMNNCMEANFDTVNADNYIEWSLDLCNQEFEEYQYERDTVKNLFNDYYDADIALFPEHTSSGYKFSLMNIVLSNLFSFCEKNNIKVIVMIIPSQIDLCENCYFKLNRTKYGFYDQRRLTKIIDELAKKNSLMHIDLYDIFRGHNPRLLYFDGGDDHWNDRGEALAAKEISKIVTGLLAK